MVFFIELNKMFFEKLKVIIQYKDMKKEWLSLIVVFLFMFHVNAQKKEYSFAEEYAVNTPFQLKAKTNDGFIKVFSSEKKSLIVQFVVTKDEKLVKMSRTEFEQHFNLKITQDKYHYEITASLKDEEKKKYWQDVRVSFEIVVPRETSCDIYTLKGSIDVKGLNSNQKLKTDDGTIDIAKSSGNAQLESSNGDILFKDFSGSITAFTSNGKVQGNVKNLKDSLVLTSENGLVNVIIPGDIGVNLFLKGKLVNTSLEKFTGTSERNFVQGPLNGGGIPVRLTSLKGNVTLFFK
jgi:hypothetical protein